VAVQPLGARVEWSRKVKAKSEAKKLGMKASQLFCKIV
jgi:hypothetical protein